MVSNRVLIYRQRQLSKICYIVLALLMIGLTILVFIESYNAGTVRTEIFEAVEEVEMKNKIDFVEKQIDNEHETWVSGETRKKVVIGAVSCRNQSIDASNITSYTEKTVTMFKSVLISAKLYNISSVEIHLFLEYMEDEQYFMEALAKMGFPTESGPELVLITHAAVDVVPEVHREHMVYHPRYRCGYVRYFFPSALPEVDSILHLDSDMIVTGNLWKLWSHVDQLQGQKFIAFSRAYEANDTHYIAAYKKWFLDIPHPHPKGTNAGLLLMNLTKMREFDWESKFLQVYDDYSKLVHLTGQRTVNILLAYNPGIWNMLSCQFNFFHRHCDKGFTCLDTLEKDGGIHLVHGNGFKFELGGSFHEIYKAYQKFDMTILNEYADDPVGLEATVRNQLMIPIRKAYQEVSYPCVGKCYGTLNHILFREFFDDSTNLTTLLENV